MPIKSNTLEQDTIFQKLESTEIATFNQFQRVKNDNRRT